jgi:hypothetical protein
MLAAQLVIAADHGPVEQAPHRLHGVRVDVTTDPFILPVVDRGMNRVLVSPVSSIQSPLLAPIAVAVESTGPTCKRFACQAPRMTVRRTWSLLILL